MRFDIVAVTIQTEKMMLLILMDREVTILFQGSRQETFAM